MSFQEAPGEEARNNSEPVNQDVSVSGSETGRSIVVDEAFFEEQFLRCQVCNEKFNQNERCPKSLPCNHTFCFPCLTQIFDHAQPTSRRHLVWADESLDGTLKCPTCRVEIFLSRNKIKELPNDHRVVQMMDFLSRAIVKSKNVCNKHDRQPLSFFCKKCLVPVCRDCTVLDHKETENHIIIDVSAALNENSTQFGEIENKSKQMLEKMKARSDALANASKRLDILERHMKSDIKETFIEYRLLLEKRQEALTNIVSQIVKEQKALVNARFVGVCEQGTQLQKLYDDFRASRKSNDIQKLFTIQQAITDNNTDFSDAATHDDNELFQSCVFEAQNEGSFLTDLSTLGEVRKQQDMELKEKVSQQQLVLLDMEQQRERQRQLDHEFIARHYADCDEFLQPQSPSSGVPSLQLAESDEENENDVTTLAERLATIGERTPTMSRLISHYATILGEEQPEEELPVPAVQRRQQRRGRRNRDTNSSQEGPDPMEMLRAVTGASHLTGCQALSRYRVVRNPECGRNNLNHEDSA